MRSANVFVYTDLLKAFKKAFLKGSVCFAEGLLEEHCLLRQLFASLDQKTSAHKYKYTNHSHKQGTDMEYEL
jgi:hypothetical protein